MGSAVQLLAVVQHMFDPLNDAFAQMRRMNERTADRQERSRQFDAIQKRLQKQFEESQKQFQQQFADTQKLHANQIEEAQARIRQGDQANALTAMNSIKDFWFRGKEEARLGKVSEAQTRAETVRAEAEKERLRQEREFGPAEHEKALEREQAQIEESKGLTREREAMASQREKALKEANVETIVKARHETQVEHEKTIARYFDLLRKNPVNLGKSDEELAATAEKLAAPAKKRLEEGFTRDMETLFGDQPDLMEKARSAIGQGRPPNLPGGSSAEEIYGPPLPPGAQTTKTKEPALPAARGTLRSAFGEIPGALGEAAKTVKEQLIEPPANALFRLMAGYEPGDPTAASDYNPKFRKFLQETGRGNEVFSDTMGISHVPKDIQQQFLDWQKQNQPLSGSALKALPGTPEGKTALRRLFPSSASTSSGAPLPSAAGATGIQGFTPDEIQMMIYKALHIPTISPWPPGMGPQ